VRASTEKAAFPGKRDKPAELTTGNGTCGSPICKRDIGATATSTMSRTLQIIRVFAAVLAAISISDRHAFSAETIKLVDPAPLAQEALPHLARPSNALARLLPQPERSSPPSPQTWPLAAHARDFINAYGDNVDGDSGVILSYLASIYAPL
jgi:hypothetical protein